ncbi:MAG: hypothetical protein J5850_04235, partial [Clostridia bacterium]|nr:hypothetical protein [Clostridia bacterium]
KLPDPFTFENGDSVKTKDDWEKRRSELFKSVVEIQYGKMPPEPEFLECELICNYNSGKMLTYRVRTGRKSHPIVFKMLVFRKKPEMGLPAVINGDLCFGSVFSDNWVNSFTDEGVALVLFDRTDFAIDLMKNEKQGQLYDCYPEVDCGSIMAWAWGFSRCMDALEKLDIVRKDCISFSGHSRGGKAALLAGALDKRAFAVNSNGSGRGGSGCYRIRLECVEENGLNARDERMSDADRFGVRNWYGPEMAAYAGREADLPFDQHYLKALVAPRILVETEAASDTWANSVGTWETALAAKEVYKFLGAENGIYLYFRSGYHRYSGKDIRSFISVLKHYVCGTPAKEGSFDVPFKKKDLIFDWNCPEYND